MGFKRCVGAGPEMDAIGAALHTLGIDTPREKHDVEG
jgi:hypothetical protein